MSDPSDLLGYAFDKNPVDFASSLDSILRAKALDAIEAKRIEFAQSIYGEDTDDDADLTVDDDYDSDEDDGYEDDEDIDIDLDDVDLDLDDIDLDDYPTEE